MGFAGFGRTWLVWPCASAFDTTQVPLKLYCMYMQGHVSIQINLFQWTIAMHWHCEPIFFCLTRWNPAYADPFVNAAFIVTMQVVLQWWGKCEDQHSLIRLKRRATDVARTWRARLRQNLQVYFSYKIILWLTAPWNHSTWSWFGKNKDRELTYITAKIISFHFISFFLLYSGWWVHVVT